MLLLYFIAKPFYKLAEETDKNKWLYAILSIVVFYAGVFIGGIALTITLEIIFKYSEKEIDDTVMGICALPFGILSAWLLYKLIDKKWKAKTDYTYSDILDENIHG